MNLAKAIEIVEKHGVVDEKTTWGDYLEATKLLIEAGKRLQQDREYLKDMPFTPLPGETED